jgi:hypothetical protein
MHRTALCITPATVSAGTSATCIFHHLKFIRFRKEGVSNVLFDTIFNPLIVKSLKQKSYEYNQNNRSFE